MKLDDLITLHNAGYTKEDIFKILGTEQPAPADPPEQQPADPAPAEKQEQPKPGQAGRREQSSPRQGRAGQSAACRQGGDDRRYPRLGGPGL